MTDSNGQVRLVGHSLAPLYPNPLGSQGKTIQSQVELRSLKVSIYSLLTRPSQINLDLPDLEKFPLFKEATVEHCILSPGEMLFIPAFYWHQVRQYLVSFFFFFLVIKPGQRPGHWHLHQHVLRRPRGAHLLRQALPSSLSRALLPLVPQHTRAEQGC